MIRGLLRPRVRLTACPACDAELPSPATWCGACGAHLDTVAVREREDEEPATVMRGAPDEPGDTPGVVRPTVVIAALVAVLVVAAVVLRPQPVGAPLTGRLDLADGASSTAPPHRDLALAWQDDVPAAGGATLRSAALAWVDDGHLAADGYVLDLAAGQVVGDSIADPRAGRSAREVPLVDDGVLYVIDDLTGVVVEEVVLDVEPGTRVRPVGLTRVDGRFVVEVVDGPGGGARQGFLGADGGIRILPAGNVVVGVTRTHAVVVDGRTGAVEVVEPTRGDPVTTLPDDTYGVTVLDDRIAFLSAGAEGWEALVTDGAGRPLRTYPIPVGPPVVLGLIGDDLAVATGYGYSAADGQVLLISPDGLATAMANFGGTADAQEPWRQVTPPVAVVDGALLVTADTGTEQLTAYRGRSELWSRPMVDVASVSGAGGVLLVAQAEGSRTPDPRTLVLDALTGEELAQLPARPARDTIHAVVEGNVAVGQGITDVGLGSLRLLDADTGRRVIVDDVIGRHVGEEAPLSFTLRGTIADLEGRTRPLLVRSPSAGRVSVARDGTLVDLDLDVSSDPYQVIPRVVGAAGDLLVLEAHHDLTPTVVLADSRTGAARQVEGVLPRAVVGGTAVGFAYEQVEVDGERVAHLAGLAGVDVSTGERRWVSERWGSEVVAILGRDDLLVLSSSMRVAALDTATGEVRWTATSQRRLSGHAVLSRDHVVVSRHDGSLAAHDLTDGAVVWSLGLDAGSVSTLTAAGDHVVAGTSDGQVVVVDARGRVVQRLGTGPVPVSDVAVVGRGIVVTGDGSVRGYLPQADGIVRDDQVDLG